MVLDQTLSSHSRIAKHATFSRMNANQLSQDTTHIYHYSVAMDIQERIHSHRRIFMTPLDKPLKRHVDIDGHAYTVVLDAVGLKLVRKAHRNGIELRWADLISGDGATSAALDEPSSQSRV
jgi:hypothetical protein